MGFHALHLTAAVVQVTAHLAQAVLRHNDLDFMTGSSSLHCAFRRPSLKTARAAISNAGTLESTSWQEPSISVALKSITGTRRAGLEHQLDAGELAFSAPLLLVGVVDLRLAAEHLSIGDLRGTGIDGDAELAADAVDQPLKVLLAQAPAPAQ